MRPFSGVEAAAQGFHGGAEGVERLLAAPAMRPGSLADPDDRMLAHIARAVFSAGFAWSVIEAKWTGFEAAFEGFDPRRVAFYADEDLDRLLADAAIVRNGAKIRAVIDNARFVREEAERCGSFGAFLAAWPADDQIGLMALLARRGSRLGGGTGQYVLRACGWDAFILSPDVVEALIREGVVDRPPTSAAAMRRVQEAFNRWSAESGRARRDVSGLLALSVGPG